MVSLVYEPAGGRRGRRGGTHDALLAHMVHLLAVVVLLAGCRDTTLLVIAVQIEPRDQLEAPLVLSVFSRHGAILDHKEVASPVFGEGAERLVVWDLPSDDPEVRVVIERRLADSV